MTSRMSPVVRRLLEARQLDPATMTGTGEDGRITRRDVYVAATAGAYDVRPQAGTVSNAPVTAAVVVDFERVERTRGAVPSASGAAAFLPFVARAVCDNFAGFPHVNASVVGDTLVVRSAVHLRVVLEIGVGRVVTGVIRDAGTKTLAAIGREVQDLVEGERSDAPTGDSPDATFTIRQSHASAAQFTVPILGGPGVAMLSIDAIGKQLVVAAETDGRDAIAVRRAGTVSLTWDHRAFDGAYGSSFVDAVRKSLEQHDWAERLAESGGRQ